MGEAKSVGAASRRMFVSGVEYMRRIGNGLVEVGFYQNSEESGRLVRAPSEVTLVLPAAAIPQGIGLAFMALGYTCLIDEDGKVEMTH